MGICETLRDIACKKGYTIQIWFDFDGVTLTLFSIGHVDEAIHNMAHFLDLRGGGVDGASWLVRSLQDEQFTGYTLLLYTGSLPLCPAQILEC